MRTHTHTRTSKDEPRLVRASYWAVLSDYLCMANPLDTPWEVIIHKRGCSHRTVTFHNACLSVIFWIKMYNSYWLVICFLQAISIPQTMFWKLTFLQLSVPFTRSWSCHCQTKNACFSHSFKRAPTSQLLLYLRQYDSTSITEAKSHILFS